MEPMVGENMIVDGWFMEKNEQWPGQAFALEVDEILSSTTSKYQDLLVFKSKEYGNVLVLDGVIQCTERDEFAYQEMLAYLPLACHPSPKQVLIIGGGDGGIAREVAKHPGVEAIVLCEIDEEVINASKKFMPGMARGFESPKLRVHIGDGFEFMERHRNSFDVIISDISDPVGPAERLFSEDYYRLMHAALKEGGVLAVQAESMWIHLKLVRLILDFARGLFGTAAYASAYVPSYPCGQIGFLIASKEKNANFCEPVRMFTESEKDEMGFKYYDEEVHRAAFVLPRVVRKELGLAI